MSDCNQACNTCSEDCQRRDMNERCNKLSRIKRVIAIASGKGGVGKSLVTSMLAIALQQKGYKTGILDADITGPSIPKIFNIKDKLRGNDLGWFPNVSQTGIQIMSSNMLLKNDSDPVVWRGPVIAGLVKQFWKDVVWQDVDFLFVDMPPGTGDVPLTVYQNMHVDGIIIVTSPQELVSMIVAKAVRMANMMHIPIIGLIENMSYYVCEKCGHEAKIFGDSHIEDITKQFSIDILGKIPVDPSISLLCDQGLLETKNHAFLNQAVLRVEEIPVKAVQVAITVKNDDITSLGDEGSELLVYQTLKGAILHSRTIKIQAKTTLELMAFFAQNKIDSIITTHADTKFKVLTGQGISIWKTESKDVEESINLFLDHLLSAI